MKIYINGKFFDKKNAKVSVFDHGFLYGYGVFETLRAYSGKIFAIKEHLERLKNSANFLKIKIPLNEIESEKAINETLKVNKLKNAYIRISISKGIGEIGYTAKCGKPTIVIIAEKFKPYPKSFFENGVKAVTVNVERIFPIVKTTNCIPNAIARANACALGAFEAILIDKSGKVTEGTVSNVFIVKKNVLYTPKNNILFGVTRQKVIELAKKFNLTELGKNFEKGLKLKIIESDFKKNLLYSADECFITSTTMQIMPIVKIDGKKIGIGKVGKITKKLMNEFDELVDLWLEKTDSIF